MLESWAASTLDEVTGNLAAGCPPIQALVAELALELVQGLLRMLDPIETRGVMEHAAWPWHRRVGKGASGRQQQSTCRDQQALTNQAWLSFQLISISWVQSEHRSPPGGRSDPRQKTEIPANRWINGSPAWGISLSNGSLGPCE